MHIRFVRRGLDSGFFLPGCRSEKRPITDHRVIYAWARAVPASVDLAGSLSWYTPCLFAQGRARGRNDHWLWKILGSVLGGPFPEYLPRDGVYTDN